MKAIAILTSLLLCGSAFAAGDPGGSAAPERKDPVMEKVAAATSKQDWAGAAGVLKEALAKEPNNANYHNLYA